MTEHLFLSEDWIEAARSLYQKRTDAVPVPVHPVVRMNLVVEDVPFGPGTLDAHLDTSAGVVEIELGHLGSADVKVTLAYDTAQAVLIEGDGQAAMQAFMAGRIRVEGDLSTLLGAFSGSNGPVEGEIAAALRSITAPRPA